MRLMDAELGEAKANATGGERVSSNTDRISTNPERVGSIAERVGSNADRVVASAERGGSSAERVRSSAERVSSNAVNSPAVQGGVPLPLPDASALDWAALVHTATRAMLQV